MAQTQFKKMNNEQSSILVKMRHLRHITIDSVRRTFKNGQLRTIGNTPWSSFALSEDDLKIIKQVQNNIGQVIATREKNKRWKKKRHQLRRAHHTEQPQISVSENPEEIQKFYSELNNHTCGMADVDIREIEQNVKKTQIAA